MNFCIKKAHEFDNNDVFILETVHDYCVINDDDKGIILLNHNLELVKKIPFFCSFYPYLTLKNDSQKEILLYSPEEQLCIHVDLKKGISRKIQNEEIKGILSFYSFWQGNKIISVTYDGAWYCINTETGGVVSVKDELIQHSYPLLYMFRNRVISRQYEHIYAVNAETQTVVGLRNSRPIFDDYRSNVSIKCHEPISSHHNVAFQNGVFMLLSEKELRIVQEESSTALEPSEGYVFLKSCFLRKEIRSFFVLMSDVGNSRKNKILKYSLAN